MHRMYSGVLAVFCMVCPTANAASGVVVLDASSAERAIHDIEEDLSRDESSLSFYQDAELFPAVGVPAESAIDEHRDERTSSFLTIRVGAREVTLRDVPLKEWFAPYVRDIAGLGLVSGYRDAAGMPTGSFGPADPVTLEQIAKVAVLASGVDASACPLPPMNLSASGSWSASYVSCAEQRQWAVFSDPTTDLRRPATREEVVMTMLQAFKKEFDVDSASLPFTDVEKTSAFAPAIAKAAADGIVSGYTDGNGNLTGTFGPTNNVTRAEFSKIVSIVLQLYTM